MKATSRLLLLVLSFVCFLSLKSSASHIVGADITYKCTSTPGIFEITFVFYRDCSGIPLCPGGCGTACTQTLQLSGADPGCSTANYGSVTLNLVRVSDADKKPYCGTGTKNTCTNMGCVTPGTYSPGIERYEFKGQVNIGPTSGIPTSCCNVRLSVSTSARNGNISTGAANQNFYTDVTINRCLSVSPCNSSPTFTSEPFFTFCGGKSAIFSNGAYDIDDDSLSFAFAPALQAYGSPVTYLTPFTYYKPLPWEGNDTARFPAGIHCDPITGDVLFTPPNAGALFVGIMVIEVKQWKKIGGVMTNIGTTRRDIESIIRGDCPPNNSPVMSTEPNDNSVNYPRTRWETCAGKQLCFNVMAKDTDQIDTTYLIGDTTLTKFGATFSPLYNAVSRKNPNPAIGGPREDYYQFCWTPHDSLARENPYFFTITAYDSKCPDPGRIRFGFSIKVNPSPNLEIVSTGKGCGKWQIGYNNLTTQISNIKTRIEIAQTPNDYYFTNGSYLFLDTIITPDILLPQPGKYLVKLTYKSGDNCEFIKFDTLTVTDVPNINTSDTLVCSGSPVQLTATVTQGVAPFQYRWYNHIADTSSAPLNGPDFSTPNFSVMVNQTKMYILQVKDSLGCIGYKSFTTKAKQFIEDIQVTNLICHGANNGSIQIVSIDSLSLFQYKLDSGTFQSGNTFNNLSAGNYKVTAKDSNGCQSTMNVSIMQPSEIKDTLSLIINESCVGLHNGSIQPHATGGTKPYRFSLDSVLYTSNPLYSNLTPRQYSIHVLDSNNCYGSFTQTVNAADTLKTILSFKNPTCADYINGEISLNTSGGKRPYQYQLGNGSFVSDSIFRNLAPDSFIVKVKDANGCLIAKTTKLTNPTPLVATSIGKNKSCYWGSNDASVQLFASGGTPPYKFKYLSSSVYDTNSFFNNVPMGSLTFNVKDSFNCVAEIYQTITTAPEIKVTVGNRKGSSCYEIADASFYISTKGGFPPYKINLDSTVFVSDTVFTNILGGWHNFVLQDSASCILAGGFSIDRPAKVVSNFSLSGISCNGKSDGSIKVTPISGRIPFRFNINGSAFDTISSFNNLPADTYFITVKDSGNCKDTFSIVMQEPEPIVASIAGPTTSKQSLIETYSAPIQQTTQYQWTASKGTVILGQTSQTAMVRWDSLGLGNVKLKMYQDTACFDTTSVDVNIGITGLNELTESWGLVVYPNPTKNILNVDLKHLPSEESIQLFDIQGKQILQQELKLKQQLNLEKLTPGLYILKIGDWSGQILKE